MWSRSISYRLLKYNRIGINFNFKRPDTNFALYHLLKHVSSSKRESWKRNLTTVEQLIHDDKPLSHVIGSHPFFNTTLKLYPKVLVPRNETEDYVHKLIHIIKKYRSDESKNIRILDLCSGSGCIAIALACNLNNADVRAIDKSRKCCLNIRTNIARNLHLLSQTNSKVTVRRADVFAKNFNLEHKFDIIISNPPYIPSNFKEKVDKNVRKYESHDALFPRSCTRNGTCFHEKIIALSKKLLGKNLNRNMPRIVMEFDGKHQVPSLRKILNFSGIMSFKFRNDLRNVPRSIWIY